MLGIVHPHQQLVVGSIGHQVGDFKHKGAVPTPVAAHMVPVDKEVGHRVGTIEPYKEPFAAPTVGYVQPLGIVAYAALVVAVAGECVGGVPRVGKIHPPSTVFVYLMREPECPVTVQVYGLPLRPGRSGHEAQAEESLAEHLESHRSYRLLSS